jgi:hypothetical protein
MNRRKMMFGSVAATLSALPMQGQTDAFRMEVARILALVTNIHIGQKRSSLEQNWTPDGGLQFPNSTRYSLRSCESVKIDVAFTQENGNAFDDPNAVIAKISSPYLQYPVMD